MLISVSLFNKAIKNMHKSAMVIKEGYSFIDSTNAGMSLGFTTGILAITAIFLILEILVLFYAITIVLKCTIPGPERIVHMVLAIVFTFPYMLFSITFNKCAINNLKKM